MRCVFGEAAGREAFTQAALLLGATQRMVVATGIARVFWREPAAAVHAQLTLAEAYPDRFLLGLGGKIASDQQVIPRLIDRSGTPKPVSAMAGYLDAMDEAASAAERLFFRCRHGLRGCWPPSDRTCCGSPPSVAGARTRIWCRWNTPPPQEKSSARTPFSGSSWVCCGGAGPSEGAGHRPYERRPVLRHRPAPPEQHAPVRLRRG
ncbi:LLM class flavin-dependent oxidoreductase [Fodinicola feengrottensis]|uniref:LLM class flavin-dependent oxidoreductase n=1 Tax=Fodinicola feengrottensis TaxID=435914 RepID=UPI002442F026|nr:LLM class flavin-dependent oxidoreductase [Fodinicola feengrottensis]